MAEAGITSVRLPLFWSRWRVAIRASPSPTGRASTTTSPSRREYGITIFPFVWGTPTWVAARPNVLPVSNAWRRWNWMNFLRDAAHRYGPRGTLWRDNPELPRYPIRKWEIWNEENLVNFAHNPNPRRFAELVRISGAVLHRVDHGSKVIVGGLFGRPLQTPPNVKSSTLPQPHLPEPAGEAVLRRRRPAPVPGPGKRDKAPDRKPAAGDARPPRRRHAPLCHRDWVGLRQRRVALGEGDVGPGSRAQPGLLDCCSATGGAGGSAASTGSPGSTSPPAVSSATRRGC